MTDLLQINKLTVALNRAKKSTKLKLIEGIDLKIKSGQSFGIVGESGCGKSLTANSIIGLLQYPLSVDAQSEILFYDENKQVKDILSLNEKALCKLRGNEISMIFQDPMTALDPVYTIEDQMIQALYLHHKMNKKHMREIVAEMLDKVKIPNPTKVLKDYPHQLSGGMLQRVMIAIALINNPRLLIADEPTTALDVTIQAQILDLINALKHQYNTAVIMITHDLGVIAETCEEVAVFYAGQVVEQTKVTRLFDSATHPYTAGLLKSVRSLDTNNKRLYTIKGTVPTAGDFGNGCRFVARCEYALPICSKHCPELVEIAPNHKCRCHLNALEKNNEK